MGAKGGGKEENIKQTRRGGGGGCEKGKNGEGKAIQRGKKEKGCISTDPGGSFGGGGKHRGGGPGLTRGH